MFLEPVQTRGSYHFNLYDIRQQTRHDVPWTD